MGDVIDADRYGLFQSLKKDLERLDTDVRQGGRDISAT